MDHTRRVARRIRWRRARDRYAVPAGLILGLVIAALIDHFLVPGGAW